MNYSVHLSVTLFCLQRGLATVPLLTEGRRDPGYRT